MGQSLQVEVDEELGERLSEKCRVLQLTVDEVVSRLIEGFVEAHTQGEDEAFAEGLTTGDYYALSEEEREALWSRWERVAEQRVGYVVRKPGRKR